MSNLSKIRRDKMIEFLETLKEQHSDDESLIAIIRLKKNWYQNAMDLCGKNMRKQSML